MACGYRGAIQADVRSCSLLTIISNWFDGCHACTPTSQACIFSSPIRPNYSLFCEMTCLHREAQDLSGVPTSISWLLDDQWAHFCGPDSGQESDLDGTRWRWSGGLWWCYNYYHHHLRAMYGTVRGTRYTVHIGTPTILIVLRNLGTSGR